VCPIWCLPPFGAPRLSARLEAEHLPEAVAADLPDNVEWYPSLTIACGAAFKKVAESI
jgi:hypothetical protein